MFRAQVLIVRRAKLYCTVSGIITLIGGRPVRRLREDTQIERGPEMNVKNGAVLSLPIHWVQQPNYLILV
jgi:hypothetical protein